MVTMYNIIEFLCEREGIKPGKLCAQLGLSRGILSDLKSGRSKSLSLANMQKIASYFGVSTDIFNEGVFEDTLPNSADMEYLRDVFLLENYKKKTPSIDGEREVSDDDLKFALWGDVSDITDDDLDDVRRYAAFIKERKKRGHE